MKTDLLQDVVVEVFDMINPSIALTVYRKDLERCKNRDTIIRCAHPTEWYLTHSLGLPAHWVTVHNGSKAQHPTHPPTYTHRLQWMSNS